MVSTGSFWQLLCQPKLPSQTMWTLATAAGALLFLCGGPRGFGATQEDTHSENCRGVLNEWLIMLLMIQKSCTRTTWIETTRTCQRYDQCPLHWRELGIKSIQGMKQLPGSTWSHPFLLSPPLLEPSFTIIWVGVYHHPKGSLPLKQNGGNGRLPGFPWSFWILSAGWLPTNHLIFNPTACR